MLRNAHGGRVSFCADKRQTSHGANYLRALYPSWLHRLRAIRVNSLDPFASPIRSEVPKPATLPIAGRLRRKPERLISNPSIENALSYAGDSAMSSVLAFPIDC